MGIDTPASGGGVPGRSRRQALLYDQAGVRDRVVDDHRFVVPARKGWGEASFRLQVFTGAGLRSVAVVTQVVPVEGAGPINHAERYVEAVWRQRLPAEPRPPILIGHMLTDYGDGEEVGDLGWMPVDFRVVDAASYEVRRPPIWGGRMDAAELEYLVGQPVDPGRGTFRAPRRVVAVEDQARRPWWRRAR